MTCRDRRRALAVIAGTIALAGCAGVPLRTVARLRTVRPDDLLAADAREFGIALELDARVKTASGRVPVVDLALRPVDDGAFQPLILVLACAAEPASPGELGLRAARPGRHWLVYRLAEDSARDLAVAQAKIRDARDRKLRGTLAVGVRNDWIAEVYPVAVGSEASTWVRMKRSEGFFELWSGRVPPLPVRT
jgi:hypothetical protein